MSISATPVSDPDNISENHYSQVRERTYDVVKDVRARGATNSMASHDFDPYAKVRKKAVNVCFYFWPLHLYLF